MFAILVYKKIKHLWLAVYAIILTWKLYVVVLSKNKGIVENTNYLFIICKWTNECFHKQGQINLYKLEISSY